MNEREKNLILILVGAAFIIANLFGFTTYSTSLKKKEAQLKTGASELKLKRQQIEEADERIDEIDWLAENRPADNTHDGVLAELVAFTEQSANKNRINIRKHPKPLPAKLDEVGNFSQAVVRVSVDCRDAELYRWLCELQDPKKARAITRLKIMPQRDDATRISCEVEVSQWFTPVDEEDSEATAAN